jgi:hypothetical protein
MTDQPPDAGPPFNPYILFDERLTVYKLAGGGGIILSAIYIAAASESRVRKTRNPNIEIRNNIK